MTPARTPAPAPADAWELLKEVLETFAEGRIVSSGRDKHGYELPFNRGWEHWRNVEVLQERILRLLAQQPAAQAPALALREEIEEHRRWLWLNEGDTPERQARDLLHRQLEYERNMRRDLEEAQRWVSAARAALAAAEAGEAL